MAEFCLDCWNKVNKTRYSKRKYLLSKDLELCEECGEWKNVIVAERRGYRWRKIKYFVRKQLRKKDLW